MADTTQGDTDIEYLGPLAPALIALIAGLLIHLFIIGVNVSDWWKGRSVTAVDYIITSLGISRMGTQCANTLFFLVGSFFLRNLPSHISLFFIDTVYAFFSYANFWLTSLLSIVLCLKISNFHSRLFLYLRGLIIHRTGHLIVASVPLSAFSFLLHLLMSIIEEAKGGTYNTTMTNVSVDCKYINDLHIYTIVFFPLLSYCISSVVLFTSLYHHTTKMKMSSNLFVNLATYYSVMRFVFFTFIYTTLYISGHLVCLLYYYFYCDQLSWLYVGLGFLPVLHSSYLIYRTAKLRSQMSKIVQTVIDFLSPPKKYRNQREHISSCSMS